MISEPHPGVRRLLERMVARLGDRPMVPDAPTPAQLRSLDVLLVEPVAPAGAMLATLARASSPSLAIVCESVTAPSAELVDLVNFAAVLVKPYTAEQLEDALALCAGASPATQTVQPVARRSVSEANEAVPALRRRS
jgi:hypothetical protein